MMCIHPRLPVVVSVPVASMSYAFAMCFASVYFGRFLCLDARNYWMRDLFYKAELDQLQDILFDLLPPFYVSRLIRGCSSIPVSKCRVVVLQLDLVGFTGT